MRKQPTPTGQKAAFSHRPTGIRAFDDVCLGLPVGALTQLAGRHAIDVDLFIDALRRADPDIAVLKAEYELVTKEYRSVVEELRNLHVQAKPVIIRCMAPPDDSRNFDGEEALLRAVGVVAKMFPRPLVLAWCGQPGDSSDDLDLLELWMASMNVGTLVETRRDDQEDDFITVAHADMVGDLFLDVIFLDPRSGEAEQQTLSTGDLA